MAVKTFTQGEKLTYTDTNTYLTNGGLVYITATTVSAAATLQINNCFTSAYSRYRITWNLKGSQSTTQAILARMVDGTTADGGSIYFNILFSASQANTLVGSTWQSNFTSLYIGLTGNESGSGAMDLHNPQVADRTTATSEAIGNSTSDYFAYRSHLYVNNNTQYEGLYMSTTAGTFTGTVTVYGYRQA